MRTHSANMARFFVGSTLLTTALLVACGKTTNGGSTSTPAPATPYYQNNGNYAGNNGNAFLPNGPRGGGFGAPVGGGPIGDGPVSGLPVGAPITDTTADFDPQEVLTPEMGRWVQVGGQSCFQPRVEADWVPFRHGYWGYDTDHGWSFESYDKFSKFTDHYAAWRHAPEQGWVSCRFPDRKYRASTVTFFDHGDNIGWTPYITGEPELYAQGAGAGFDDGYWQGASLFASVGAEGFSFHVGFTLVNRVDIGAPDIFSHIIKDRAVVFNVVLLAQRSNRFSLYPGGDRGHAYEFLAPYFPHGQIPVGRLAPVDCGNGHHYLAATGPTYRRPVPAAEIPRIGGQPQGPRFPQQPGPAPRGPVAGTPLTGGRPNHPQGQGPVVAPPAGPPPARTAPTGGPRPTAPVTTAAPTTGTETAHVRAQGLKSAIPSATGTATTPRASAPGAAIKTAAPGVALKAAAPAPGAAAPAPSAATPAPGSAPRAGRTTPPHTAVDGSGAGVGPATGFGQGAAAPAGAGQGSNGTGSTDASGGTGFAPGRGLRGGRFGQGHGG